MAGIRPSVTSSLVKLEGWRQYNTWANELYGLSASFRHLKYCNPLAELDDDMVNLPEEPVLGDALSPESPNFSAAATFYQIKERLYTQALNTDSILCSVIKASLSDALSCRVYQNMPPTTAKELVIKIKQIAKPDARVAKQSAEAEFTKLLHQPVPIDSPKATKAWWDDWFKVEQQLRDTKSPLLSSVPEGFLAKTQAINPTWYENQIDKVDEGRKANSLLTHVNDLERFLERKKFAVKPTGAETKMALATLNSDVNDDSKTKTKRKRELRECFCGEAHLYSQSPYIVASAQPVGWIGVWTSCTLKGRHFR